MHGVLVIDAWTARRLHAGNSTLQIPKYEYQNYHNSHTKFKFGMSIVVLYMTFILWNQFAVYIHAFYELDCYCLKHCTCKKLLD